MPALRPPSERRAGITPRERPFRQRRITHHSTHQAACVVNSWLRLSPRSAVVGEHISSLCHWPIRRIEAPLHGRCIRTRYQRTAQQVGVGVIGHEAWVCSVPAVQMLWVVVADTAYTERFNAMPNTSVLGCFRRRGLTMRFNIRRASISHPTM